MKKSTWITWTVASLMMAALASTTLAGNGRGAGTRTCDGSGARLRDGSCGSCPRTTTTASTAQRLQKRDGTGSRTTSRQRLRDGSCLSP